MIRLNIAKEKLPFYRKPPEDFGWWEHSVVRPYLYRKNILVRALVKELCGYDPMLVANLIHRSNQVIRLLPPNNGDIKPGNPTHIYQMVKLVSPSIRELICRLDPEFAKMQGYRR